MGYNPFGTVSSYRDMLAKIGVFAFISAVLAVSFLRQQVPSIDDVLRPYSLSVPIAGVSVPLGTLVIAFSWAFVCRVIKLHDRVSDLLGIRRKFDVKHVLKPMAAVAGVDLTPRGLAALECQRKRLMNELFYRYTSSGTGRAVIDSHYITMALDQWTWFWVILEAMVTWGLVAAVLLFSRRFLAPAIIVIVGGGSVLLLSWSWRASIRYARDEIDQILTDEQRKAVVTGQFDALQG